MKETEVPKREDRRVRKTKRQIRQAFTELLKEKPIQAIKVREIADRIDINRGTFYQHYRDIYDLLNKIEDELFQEFNDIIGDTNKPINITDAEDEVKQLLVQIFSFIKDNADLAMALMGPNGDPVFVDKVKDLIRMRCIHDWMHALKRGKETMHSQRFEYYYAFIVSGCIGLLQTWLESGTKESPEELAELVVNIMLNGMKAM